MATTDHEAEQRERRLGGLRGRGVAVEQPVRVDVALDVVHADERQVVRDRQRLGDVDSNQQRANQARAVGHRDGVKVLPAGPRLLERGVERGNDPAQLLPRGNFRDDAAGRRVQRDLARHLVGLDPATADHDRHSGLVA